MDFLTVLILAAALIGIGIIGMAIKLFFDKTKKILNMHIGSNKDMKARGISCAQSWDKMEQKKVKDEVRKAAFQKELQSLTLSKD